MAHFLLIYDRSRECLISQQEYATRAQAMTARFSAEAEYQDRRHIEIVAFDAESEEELRRTHGRYFLTLSELAARAAS